jgi:addiction module RelE/StbE family toxin
MRRIVFEKDFFKSAKKLEMKEQKKLAQLLVTLKDNPFNPHLHTKKLRGKLQGIYSFRITRNWRVIFQFQNPDFIQLLTVKNRKDIYR